MALLHISLEDISEADIDTLIAQKVPESRYIEYKRETYAKDDKGRDELRKDVSAFANTQGGDIIIGIDNSVSIFPFTADAEQEKEHLETTLRYKVQPRIFFTIKTVKVTGGSVIIIRIHPSYSLPHMITDSNNHNLYFGRGSSGKYQLDNDQLRNLFNKKNIIMQIREWHKERIEKIITREAPFTLLSNPLMVVHLVALSTFNSADAIDLQAAINNKAFFAPLDRKGDYLSSINFDGVAFWYDHEGYEVPQRYYSQVFHSGNIESVYAVNAYSNGNIDACKIIDNIKSYVPQYVNGLEKCGVNAPIAILASLVNIKGHSVAFGNSNRKILSKHLFFMESIIQNIPDGNSSYEDILRPTLDHIANTAGRISFVEG